MWTMHVRACVQGAGTMQVHTAWLKASSSRCSVPAGAFRAQRNQAQSELAKRMTVEVSGFRASGLLKCTRKFPTPGKVSPVFHLESQPCGLAFVNFNLPPILPLNPINPKL